MSAAENAGFIQGGTGYTCPECSSLVFGWDQHLAWHVSKDGNWPHGNVTLCKHCLEEIDGEVHAAYNDEYCNDDTGHAADPIGAICTPPCVGYDTAYGVV